MWLHKRDIALIPSDPEAAKAVEKLGEGEMICVKKISVRSGPWHRWYFGCCKEIGLHQEPERLESTIDYAIRFWSGHVEEIRDAKGRIMEVPKRIAFDKLTSEEWAMLWPSFEKTMIEKFGFDPVAWKEQGRGFS